MAYLIIGYGITGQEAEIFCKKKNYKYFIYDDKLIQDGIYNDPNEIPWEQVSKAMVSPGVPTWKSLPDIIVQCRQRGIPVFSDLDILFHHNSHKLFLGVTGSQGKTTVHDVIYQLMDMEGWSVAMGGNNGIGALSLDNDVFFLEASMQQLFVSQSIIFDGGIFNNFFDTHQEMGSFNGRRQAKAKLLVRAQGKKQKFVIGDFPKGTVDLLGSWVRDEDVIIYGSNYHHRDDIKSKNYLWIQSEGQGHFVEYSINGTHNTFSIPTGGFNLLAEENVGVVMAFLLLYNLWNPQKFLSFINQYKPVDHRLSIINKNNINFFNCSKCTNTFAFQSLVKNIHHQYGGYNCWILGGILNSPVENFYDESLVNDTFFIIGRDGSIIHEYLKNKYKNIFLLDNLEEVFLSLQDKPRANPFNLILAPGCQSMDQFKDFQGRGSVFTSLIEKYYK
jgi:UDP-N-acetylmuramoylalanine--D-glutamate ligase